MELWYATGFRETSQVVTVGHVPAFGQAPFFARPQLTGGEPRFPRVGKVMSDYGAQTQTEYPRTPNVRPYYWCRSAPDSFLLRVKNYGGWAYHVAVTLQNRDGVRDFAPALGRMPAYSDWTCSSIVRESSGVVLLPKILKVRWEDYGGLRDSIVSPPVDTTAQRCY